MGVPASIPGTPERLATPRRSVDATTSTGEIANGSTAKVATEVACPVCTFLNHASMRNCEICSTALPRPNGRTGVAIPASQGGGPAGATIPDNSSNVIRLSFRKEGAKMAYAKVKSALGQKAWERDVSRTSRLAGAKADRYRRTMLPDRPQLPYKAQVQTAQLRPHHAQASTPSSLPLKSAPIRAKPTSLPHSQISKYSWCERGKWSPLLNPSTSD